MEFVGPHFIFQVGLLKSSRELMLHLEWDFSFKGKITWPLSVVRDLSQQWEVKTRASGSNVESLALQ